MLVEEFMHVSFYETNQNMQKSPKIGTDDEVPNIQQVDIGLENKTEEISRPPKIQSTEPESQLIEYRVGIEVINSRLPREWRVPKNLLLDNVIGQV